MRFTKQTAPRHRLYLPKIWSSKMRLRISTILGTLHEERDYGQPRKNGSYTKEFVYYNKAMCRSGMELESSIEARSYTKHLASKSKELVASNMEIKAASHKSADDREPELRRYEHVRCAKIVNDTICRTKTKICFRFRKIMC